MKPFLRWCFVATALTLAGCSSTAWRKDAVLAVPLQPTLQQEVILARMEQILASRALSDDERAQLLYERGVLYDSLGLRALARNDFSQALAIRPDMPEVFNYLGIYLTQAGNFDAAYEAFDSVLELDPTYNYAHLNRGIALYYGGRAKLAQDDLLAFYQDDPNDPFRSLWLYIAERKLDEKRALEALRERLNKSDKEQWGWNIVEFYLGDISEKELMTRLKADATDNTSLAEHLSETNFYLGKYYLSLGTRTALRHCSNWRSPTTYITTLSTDTHCWNYRSWARSKMTWQNRTSNS
ncbi:lipoprotein NlpI [Klebsiella pneumoniae]|nr:lipoprotein NlpI [Klebsiella pneumoniae]